MSKCGCGRSPTGMCIGWHGLSQEEFETKLKEHRHRILERSARSDQFCCNCGLRNRFLDWNYQMATSSNQEMES